VPVRQMPRLLGLACLFALAAPMTASAITADVARTCNAAVAKAFPPKQPGNPAAGSANGSAKEQRDYFSKCAANNGKVDDAPADAPKDSKAKN